MNRTLRIAWTGLLVSLLVLAIKALAYRLTGSVALYSDALETVINVATAGAAVFALWYSARPADANHRYGHYKAEYFSAIVEGGLVLATAFMIAGAAWQGLDHPPPIRAPWLGIAVNAAGGGVNLLWALVLLREGRRARSPALLAGGRHVMTDVWTTLGVLLGFALVPLTGLAWLDPSVAALGPHTSRGAGSGGRRAAGGGRRAAVPPLAAGAGLRDAIAEGGGGAIEAHDVRLRAAGRMTFVEFHLVVPSEMTVEAAHRICDRIETAIRARVGQAVISIHVEPGYKTKQHEPREDVLLLS